MKKTRLFKYALILFVGGMMTFAAACGDDDKDYAAPTVTLSELTVAGETVTAVTAKTGQAITATVTITAPAGLEQLVVKQFRGDTEVDTKTITTFTNDTYAFTYTILAADAESVVDDGDILKFSFTATDAEEQTGTKELVVDVELTAAQLLVKYDWLRSQEIRVTTGTNDINPDFVDDVYRFNEDGTWVRSYGAIKSEDYDGFDKYCYWNFNEETNNLIMTMARFNASDYTFFEVRDTMTITSIDATGIEADVVLLGLDFFNDDDTDTPYLSSEDFVYKYAAQAKGDTFDPYTVGVEVDPEATYTDCFEVTTW